MSFPAPPTITSFPFSPYMMSFPSPPRRMSSPFELLFDYGLVIKELGYEKLIDVNGFIQY
ncbi:hypothetical protein EHE19_006745 [Ruminiclostridium herbifermentans]|uniref:Uncharacterized protein n=1 Tax=Ruminiclostridium herbifermentans TaxID=2488810 RepID=A0A7H1VRW3_9FIRM|nr:hypothetical protein EHE19_006745 [Ruminiclostridium herbifermentans]